MDGRWACSHSPIAEEYHGECLYLLFLLPHPSFSLSFLPSLPSLPSLTLTLSPSFHDRAIEGTVGIFFRTTLVVTDARWPRRIHRWKVYLQWCVVSVVTRANH
jgi:hypothetical protein